MRLKYALVQKNPYVVPLHMNVHGEINGSLIGSIKNTFTVEPYNLLDLIDLRLDLDSETILCSHIFPRQSHG